jgi:NACHT domain
VKAFRFANRLGRPTGGRSRGTGVVVLVLLITSVAAALLLARRYDLGVPQTLAAALVGGGAPAGLYLAWVSYRDSQRDAPDIGRASLQGIADQLAAAIGKQWENEARIRRLNDPRPLPVSWVAADNASLADDWGALQRLATSGAGWPPPPPPGTWAAGPEELAGTGGELAGVLARVPTGRLVVLGEPGAGKSMLMVWLVLDLLARRASGGPVPVLFSLASWDPEGKDLRGWLAAQMSTDHPALAAVAPAGSPGETSIEALLEAGLVLPILDGLDEIPDTIRVPAITRISDSDVLRAGRQVVVICRTEQYLDMLTTQHGPRPALRAAVIQLCPLDASAISQYLLDDAGGPGSASRWAPVLAVLGTTAPVAQALTRPLMISLARTIYNPRPGEQAGTLRDPAELRDPVLADQAAVEALLFDAFIPAAYRSPVQGRDHRRSWTAPQAAGWLMFLAAHLENDVDFAWWQLSRSLNRRATGLAVGCTSLLTFGLAGWIAGGRSYGVRYGLAYGLAFGLAGYLSFVFSSPLPLFRVEFRFRANALKFLTRFAVGVAVGIVLAITEQPADLPGGIAFGCVLGAYGWLSTPALARTIPSPSGTLAQDRAGTLGFSIAVAFALGSLGGLDVAGITPTSGPGFGSTGIAAAVVVCAIAGMFFGFLEYGRVGAVTYGIAGGVVGLLATAWTIPVGGLRPGLAFGCTFAISAGIAAAAPRAWGRFLLCRIFLAARGEQPWHLMSFLDDAHRRGILRQAGPVYQFRHIELQRRLTHQPLMMEQLD